MKRAAAPPAGGAPTDVEAALFSTLDVLGMFFITGSDAHGTRRALCHTAHPTELDNARRAGFDSAGTAMKCGVQWDHCIFRASNAKAADAVLHFLFSKWDSSAALLNLASAAALTGTCWRAKWALKCRPS